MNLRRTAPAVLIGLALVTGCSSEETLRPSGGDSGSFPYCAYAPTEDGIEISEDQKVPCLVTDVRESGDRDGTSPHLTKVPTSKQDRKANPGHKSGSGGGFGTSRSSGGSSSKRR